MLRFLDWKSMTRRKRFEAEMNEEFAFHRAARVQDLIKQGSTWDDAERQAQLEFGGAQRYREAHRLHWFDQAIQDILYGVRTMRRSPGFTAIVSLALGIGLNTVVFSVFESLLLRPLPINDPGKVVFVDSQAGIAVSFPDYRELRDNTAAFSGLAGYRISPMSFESDGNPRRVWGYLATGNYFDVLGIKPVLGRFFHREDDLQPGASPHAVLSYSFWQTSFGSDHSIVGKTVRINGLTYNILGVAPPEFHGTEVFFWPELWVPMMMQPQIEAGNPWLDNRFTWNTLILGRLKPGVTPSRATADLNRIATDLARRFPDADQGLRLNLSPLGSMSSSMRGPVRLFVTGLLLLVGLVLLTACLNLAGLMLARSADRQREMVIRLSIGAGASRIVRQVLTESALLSLSGGLLGYLLALLSCQMLSQWHAPLDLPVQFDVVPDWTVFFFTAAISLITALLFGFGPALQLSKIDLSGLMKGGAGTAVSRTRLGVALRDVLVAAELAVCFVLVFGSLLAVRSLQNALSMPLEFNPQGVSTAAFDLGLAGYNEAQGKAFQAKVLEAVRRLPGVTSAAYANSLPLSADQSSTAVQADNMPTEQGRKAKSATYYQISPGFLSTMEIPLLRGRDFDGHDRDGSPEVAIVNRTFAKEIMHVQDPVGKTFRRGFGDKRVQVVGLVADGKYRSLTEAPLPVLFWSIRQQYNSTTTLVIRSQRAASAVAEQVRRTLAAMDKRLPVYGTGSLEKMLGFALFPMHAAAIALSAFGLLALVLAMTGINGLAAYAVSRRTKEIGIRIALGATRFQVARCLLTRLSFLVCVGLGIGLLLTLAAGPALNSVIYEASSEDPELLLGVFAALLLTAILSFWRPLLRALRINPVRALRWE